MTAQVERVRRQMSASAFRQMTTEQAIGGGTAYATAGEAWAAVAAAAGNDDSAAARLVAKARSASMQAGRVDVGGAGFGTTYAQVREYMQHLRTGTGIASANAADRATAIQQGTSTILEGVIDSSTAGQAVYGKRSSATQIAEAHARRVESYIRSLDSGQAINIDGQDRVATERDVKQALASAQGIHDAMGQASPKNARAFADGFMGRGLNVNALSARTRSMLGAATMS